MMRMVDIIVKKRDGQILSNEEIKFFVNGYVQNTIPDYQVSALLMAIVFKGMNEEEISNLTKYMMHSGEVINLTSIKGIKADKHSTGGVGDKTSLVLGPMVAACGLKIAKMSGRGLGHTGGTLDKMEAIPHLEIELEEERFIKQVNEVGLAIVGQTGHLVPADKKLYALRDVTATVESIPLIASSIMSKKLASGSNTILLDVKFGSGAFMKDLASAKELAQTMVAIGRNLKIDTRAILTSMEQPLGLTIGNSLEVKEAILTLQDKGPSDLVNLCLEAGAIMLEQGHIVKDLNEGREMLKEVLRNGQAFLKFKEMVYAQGGDVTYLDNPSKFELAQYILPLKATKEGYVKEIVALAIGEAAMRLGAGRATYEDEIDMAAGIVLHKKVGNYVKVGDILCDVHTNIKNVDHILKDIVNAFDIVQEKVNVPDVVSKYIK